MIKAVYEVDPLKCPKCGRTMKIILFILNRICDSTGIIFATLLVLNKEYGSSEINGMYEEKSVSVDFLDFPSLRYITFE